MIIFGSDTLSASSSQGSFIARLDVSPTTGITSINNPPDRIKVYPNPAHESVSVAINTSTDSRITITLYDMIGNDVATVFSGYQGAGNYVHQTSTAGLASGTYLVKVSDGASTMVKLISVEH